MENKQIDLELELRYETYKNFIELMHGKDVVELLNKRVKQNIKDINA